MSKEESTPTKRSPTLKINLKWQDAMKRAIEKSKPDGGWPERPKRRRSKPKKRSSP